VEGRGQPERSLPEEAKVRTQSRVALPPNLERVNAAARQAAQTRFTSLLHHVNEAALYRGVSATEAAGECWGRWDDGGEVRREAGG
jgi:hypothetical protein